MMLSGRTSPGSPPGDVTLKVSPNVFNRGRLRAEPVAVGDTVGHRFSGRPRWDGTTLCLGEAVPGTHNSIRGPDRLVDVEDLLDE